MKKLLMITALADQRAPRKIDSGAHSEEGGVEMTRLRRAMALWGRTSIPFFKSM